MRVTRPVLSGSINHPVLGSGLNYQADQIREDPDGQVADTIKIMGRYALEDTGSPGVVNDAQRCLGADEVATVGNVWALTQNKIQFLRDEATAQPLNSTLAGAGEVVEVLVRPRDMAALNGTRAGDCDDYSMYAASLLTALGIPCAFVTVAGDDNHPGRFTHVYVAAYPKDATGNRVRVPVDASHGKTCGWEVLQMKPWSRKQEWALGGDQECGLWWGDVVKAALWVGAGWLAWQWVKKGRPMFGV